MRLPLLKSLRIAVTAISLLVCALLLVLWVRSYYRWDSIVFRHNDWLFHIISFDGGVATILGEDWLWGIDEIWIYEPLEIDRTESIESQWGYASTFVFPFQALAPTWFYLTIFATIAALPWIKWRFSLRTLLIVVTLFAVFFGAIAMSI